MFIRKATSNDLVDIVAIYNQSIPGRMATADLLPATVEQKETWFNSHTATRPIFVAQENDAVVGWVSLKDFYGRPAYSGTAELGIYIHQDHHKKGIAEKLMLHILDLAPSLGLHTLLGFIFAHNFPSIGLVEKFGFKVWGELPEVAILDELKASLLIFGKKL
jgi:L-amino acid N-acyltransferase YncA